MTYDRDLTIALDFDGVLHEYKEWSPIPGGRPVPGAKDAVAWMGQRYNLVIFSARANEPGGVEAIEKWLRHWEFPAIPVSLEKPKAEIYIDDRGYRFEGSFSGLLAYLMENPKPGRWGKNA